MKDESNDFNNAPAKKKRKTGATRRGPFSYHPCKKARGLKNPKCHKVICASCMTIWRNTSLKFDQQPTEQENEIQAEQAEVSSKAPKKWKGKRGKVITLPIRRPSKRNIKAQVTTKGGITHTPDHNGCCHDDVESWQTDTAAVYFNKSFRADLEQKNQGAKLLDLNCFHCKGLISKDGHDDGPL